MRVYYNEFDAKKAASLKVLMDDGFITEGDIDTRPIQEVQPDDVKQYDRCHFFAGIGLWDYALDLARWPENMRVWTGSCPCQPFSTAGRQKGKDDDRHLWPEWLRLIEECCPPAIFGEQVANAISKGWLDDVYQGLEAEGYAVGSAILPACSVGAPHKRDRLWFVAHTAHSDDRRNTGEFQAPDEFKTQKRPQERIAEPCGSSTMGNAQSEQAHAAKQRGLLPEPTATGIVGNAEHNGSSTDPVGSGNEEFDDGCAEKQNSTLQSEGASTPADVSGLVVGNPDPVGSQGQRPDRSAEGRENQKRQAGLSDGTVWAGDWLECADGKKRIVEPRICLLAHGYPQRVGLLHCAGDAIVPQVASTFIECSMEAMQ